jgi:glycosyltransferase involved in cell wall biosynthesis
VGIPRSLNAGLRAASAPVVAIQDADDWSAPNRIERQLQALAADQSVAVVGSRMREVDERGAELVPQTAFVAGDVGPVLMRFNPIPNSCAAFRKDVVLAAGGYDARYSYAAEYDLWLKLADRHTVVALEETLATRQMSPTNVAAQKERAQLRETILIRMRAMCRRRSLRGAAWLALPVLSWLTPTPLKRAVRRRRGQAP